VSDDTTAIREAARVRLPELEASSTELGELLKSVLSPAVAAALTGAPGSSAIPSMPDTSAATARATELLTQLDASLAALRTTPAETIG